MATDGPLINITVESEIWLTVDEVWPDGGAPDEPTAEDVKREMEKFGSKHRTPSDWSLADDPDVTVYVHGTFARVWNA